MVWRRRTGSALRRSGASGRAYAPTMTESTKKRRSGRTSEKAEKTSKPTQRAKRGAPIEHDPNPELHSPWVPLIWLLVPLIACIAYGVATR